jgi:hypothetical protein
MQKPAQGSLAAYWDQRYPSGWAAENVTTELRDHFEAAGYEILDADELKTWMDARIADGALSVVVFCKDIVPDTVAEENSAGCTLRQYLDAGGKVVWYSEMPMYYQGFPDGSQTKWAEAGMANILDIPGTSWTNNTASTVAITPEGTEWGLTTTWTSNRWTPSDDTFTVLATDGSGNVSAYAKHFVPGDTWGGFVRIWDFPVSAIPNIEDIQKVAEYGLGDNPYPRRPDPVDGAVHPDTWVTLSWYAGDFAVSHDVYIGENYDDVAAGTGDTFYGNQGSTSYTAGFPGFAYPEGLVPGTTYYWRIAEVNDTDPNSPWSGPVWSFTIPPKTAYNPNPQDGAEFVSPDNVTLTWTPGLGAVVHIVYFGDSFDEVNNSTVGAPFGSTTYDPGALELEKVYYWRVDEFDSIETHKGDVWSFTTQPEIPVVDPNLIGWWKLDGGHGTVVVDSSGYNHHGTCFDESQWADGRIDGAIQLYGVGDYIDIGSVGISGRDPRTLSGWAKASTTDISNWTSVFGFAPNSSADGTYFDVEVDDEGNYAIYIGGWKSVFIPVDTQWHHFAVTYDGNEGSWYLDGQFVNSIVGAVGTIDHATIGGRLGNSNSFPGLIDDVRIYDVALSDDEIAALAQ